VSRTDRIRRIVARLVWVMNPVAVRLAGLAPWWVVLETTGRKSGEPRRVPLARGPVVGKTTWLIAVHGTHAAFVKNLMAHPDVRIRIRRTWISGRAAVEPMDSAKLSEFSIYARTGPRTIGIDPVLVRIDLDR
jgi:deazaflavin-dependent oxidoreductase (nitroreductase family)